MVGAQLCQLPGQLFYWKQGQLEVDYVYKTGSQLYGIEVKSGQIKKTTGLLKFQSLFTKSQVMLISPTNYKTAFAQLVKQAG